MSDFNIILIIFQLIFLKLSEITRYYVVIKKKASLNALVDPTSLS